MKILVINGPNMNLLGLREPGIYGSESYRNLLELIEDTGRDLDIAIDAFQSNSEGAIIDKIQEALGVYDGLVINPAAYTHTGLAIGDALRAVGLASVEVHISKVSAREDFRQINFIRDSVIGSFEGLGIEGYRQAIIYLYEYLLKNK